MLERKQRGKDAEIVKEKVVVVIVMTSHNHRNRITINTITQKERIIFTFFFTSLPQLFVRLFCLFVCSSLHTNTRRGDTAAAAAVADVAATEIGTAKCSPALVSPAGTPHSYSVAAGEAPRAGPERDRRRFKRGRSREAGAPSLPPSHPLQPTRSE